MRNRPKSAPHAERDGQLPAADMVAIVGLMYAAILLTLIIGAGSIDLRGLIEGMTVLQLGDPLIAAAFTA